jgi:hypothetical protein
MTELRGLLERLVQLLDGAGVPFMVAGSFASTAHGLPRTTQDLDVVIDPPSAQALDALVASMSLDCYYVDLDAARDALRRRSMFNVVDHVSGWKVGFIVRKNRAFSRNEFARRMPMSLLGSRSRPRRRVEGSTVHEALTTSTPSNNAESVTSSLSTPLAHVELDWAA